ncbi:MAG: SDR family oxidoreductase [Gammaproteobacteria bacterium]|nr:SDR family oxidoreductase [Gammaproteobacteria bacterium]
MPATLITGANRGLGLEHAKQFAGRGWRVFACARSPEVPALTELARQHDQVSLHALDVTDHEAVDTLAGELSGTSVDVLVNNAGTTGPKGTPEAMRYQSLANMDYQIWREMLEVNLLSAFKVATAFRDHVAASDRRLLVNMSSGLGSVTNNVTGNMYAYRSSKAGLNIITKGMAAEWQHLIVIAMSPGWCRTDLGGPDAQVDPVDSIRAQQELFDTLGPNDSGRYLDRFGDDVPW